MTTTALVPIRKSGATQVSLVDLAEQVARRQIEETRTVTSTRKARVEEARRNFEIDPLDTIADIQLYANALAREFDASISERSLPLSKEQINTLSDEFLQLERLRIQIEALTSRYKTLVYGHLDQTGPKIDGRPASQVPGKVEAEGPGPHYIFERRGGNRDFPDLDAEGLRGALPAELVAQLYKTVHHDATAAWDEPVFDEIRFAELVDLGEIDLDVVADYLTPGKWRTPSFYKTLVDGEQ
jgi:hypothetical protein